MVVVVLLSLRRGDVEGRRVRARRVLVHMRRPPLLEERVSVVPESWRRRRLVSRVWIAHFFFSFPLVVVVVVVVVLPRPFVFFFSRSLLPLL